MKIPIPNDWDGETWACVQIQWPDSPSWLALLRGLLSMPTRGRWWDERSGSIIGVQAIGWEIWGRNWPFVPCEGPPGPSEGADSEKLSESAIGALFDLLEECEEMAGVLDIKIEGGKLWKRMAPCCEWVEVGPLTGFAEIDEPPFELPGEPVPTYSACGKATAIVDKLYAVGDTIWDQSDNAPWDWYSKVKEQHPDLSGGKYYVSQAILQIGLTHIVGGYEVAFDSSTRQELLCRIAVTLSDDNAGITDDDWDAIKAAINGVWGVATKAIANFWFCVLAAIGKGDLSDIARMGATTTDADCDCPGAGLTDPRDSWPDTDWAYWFDLTKDTLPPEVTIDIGQHTPGHGVWDNAEATGHPSIDVGDYSTTGGTIKLVYIKYGVSPGSDYVGTNKVGVQSAGTVLLNLADSPDTDPSAGGVFTITKLVNHVIGSTEEELQADVENRPDAEHQEATDFPRILAIGFAGDGPDPLA